MLQKVSVQTILMSAFPVKSFRQALQDTLSLQIKLSKYFIVECKKHNMIWIDGITEEFYRIFSTKENLKIKVNAMYAIQYFILLAQYPIMTLFQVYILPIISQIALFRCPQQNYQATSQYFLAQGYSVNTPNIKELSHNYITLAQNFVFHCAHIKPFRTFSSSQMNEASQYKKAAVKLNKNNVRERDLGPETQQKIQASRQEYLKNLSKFDNDSQYYVSYYMKKIEKYIIEGAKYKDLLDFRKIMKYGDVYLTSEAIGHCCEALENENFSFKKNALQLIHDFVLWGDIEAIMMINYAEYVDEIFNRIVEVKGDMSINAGQEIYPQIYGQKEGKKQFYIQFLKCLQTWAMAIPKTNFDGTKSKGEEEEQFSTVFLLYIKLKNEKQFKFPDNPFLPKHKKQLEESLLMNKERNNLIMKQLQQNAQDTLSVSRKSIKPMNKFEKYKSKNSVIKEQRQSEFITRSQVAKYIQSAQTLLDQLLDKIQTNDMNQAENILNKLNDFCMHFESKLEIIDESINEDSLQSLYLKGVDRMERINSINDHFHSFKEQKINLMRLEELIKYQLTRRISHRTISKYTDDYKSRKSKKSMSRSFGNTNFSQNLLRNSKDKSFDLRNFSHDKFKIPLHESKHLTVNQTIENKSIHQSQSQVSRSTDRANRLIQNQNSQKLPENQVQEANGSYDFGNNNYDFQEVKPPLITQRSQMSKKSRNSSRVSKQSSLHKSRRQDSRQSSNQRLNQIQSKRNSNIYTNKSPVEKRNDSRVQFSSSERSVQKSERQFHLQKISSDKDSQKKAPSESKKQSSEKRYSDKNARVSNSRNSQSNFTKSKRLNQNSESFMIASVNMRKLNEISNTPSENSSNQNRSAHHTNNSQVPPIMNRSHHLNQNPHKITQLSDPKDLTSFNMTNIAGFSKIPPSSVNKISSIEQKKFKFEMLNSQDRQIFDDQSSKEQANQGLRKIKTQVEEDQNPGFEILFKNKSKIRNSKIQPYQKFPTQLQINDELRLNLSPNRVFSREGSKINQGRGMYQTRKSNEQKPPLSERSNESRKRSSKLEKVKYQHQRGNIYTIPVATKKERMGSRQNSKENSVDKSRNSQRSLKKTQTQYFAQQNPQNQQKSQLFQKNQLQRSQKISQTAQKIKQAFQLTKIREQFHQSSFADSSQDTPRILQRSKNYYNEQDSQQLTLQKPSIYLQKSTSPKHERISFAQSSRHNAYSKMVISERDEREEYDKSNLTPSEVPKSKVAHQNKYLSTFSKDKGKSIVSGGESKMKSHVSHTSYPSQQLIKKIESEKKIHYLANKQLQQIKQLKERLQKIQNDSKLMMDFQRSTMKSPDTPRYAITPRSPRFRDQNSSFLIEAKERISLINNSSYMSPQTKRNFDLNSSFSRQYLITPEGKLIKKKNYENYLTQLKSQPKAQGLKQVKKHLLRNKQLIHKNQNIQIGVTILRERNRLKIIYFVTPQKPIQKFTIHIEPSKKLKIKCSQNQLCNLQSQKQYKLYVNCQISEFPYSLPQLQFMYKNQRRTFYLGQGSAAIVPETRVQLLLPAFFIKFIQISQISSPQVNSLLYGRQVYRTQEFPLNPKIIKKPHEINDYIPNLTLLSETTALTIYCGKGTFFDHKFIFKLNFKMNHFVFIQAISIQTPEKERLCQNILEWFLVCMEELFLKQINFDQRKQE